MKNQITGSFCRAFNKTNIISTQQAGRLDCTVRCLHCRYKNAREREGTELLWCCLTTPDTVILTPHPCAHSPACWNVFGKSRNYRETVFRKISLSIVIVWSLIVNYSILRRCWHCLPLHVSISISNSFISQSTDHSDLHADKTFGPITLWTLPADNRGPASLERAALAQSLKKQRSYLGH